MTMEGFWQLSSEIEWHKDHKWSRKNIREKKVLSENYTNLLMSRSSWPISLAGKTNFFQHIPDHSQRKEKGQSIAKRWINHACLIVILTYSICNVNIIDEGKGSYLPSYFFFSCLCLTRRAEPKAPFPICSSISYCSMWEMYFFLLPFLDYTKKKVSALKIRDSIQKR